MTFDPQDPDFRSAVRESFDRLTLMRTIGAALERVAPGEVDVMLPFRDDLTQHHGFMAAAVLTAVVDVACGYAAMTLMPRGSSVLTIEYKANFLAPAQGEKLLARGRVIRPGRTVTVCAGDVVAVEGGHETLVATLLATMMRIAGERLVSSPAAETQRHHQSVIHARRSRRWCLCRAWRTRAPDSTALV
ncbi:MAG: PaaI family thioesterase [Candidatus Rokubacteria bacterium]|nr:PaaI family thioesterase [Candidatus Rokubacteria bacterium]